MDRREFLKDSLLASGATALHGRLRAAGTEVTKPGEKLHVQYIRDKIPSFEVPPYRGESYEDRVPDTLDIAERAKLAIHALTSITDPAADDEVYWAVGFFRNPIVMLHDFNDWILLASALQEALPLLRVATGSSLNCQVDPVWMQVLLKSIGPDGLVYVPLVGRPWSRLRYSAIEVDPVWRSDGSRTNVSDLSVTQIAHAQTCGGALGPMALYYLRDRNPLWMQAGDQMVQRLSRLMIEKGDYGYFIGSWEPNGKIDPQAEMPTYHNACAQTGWLVQGLAQFYKVTGHEQALELTGRVVRYYKDHSRFYDANGEWQIDDIEKHWMEKYDVKNLVLGGHGHSHALGLEWMTEYATAANDRDTLEFVKASYEWAKNQAEVFGVSSLVGWFPEFYVPRYPSCESCTVADMVALSVMLSKAGVADYWDNADRWVQNNFIEQQLTDVDWVYRMAERQPRKPVAPNETANHTPERNVGAFAGWSSGNDWTVNSGIMHCCMGSSARALYYVWEHMLDYKDRALRVNLLLNRASRWADVYSHVPYQGRVDVKMKESCRSVQVRAPEWVEGGSPQLQCKVNGARRQVRWEGRYVEVGPAKPGEVISVTFPIAERTVKERIGPETYTLVLKGNTVVSIEPVGKNGPLYQGREKYRKQEVQWRRVKRFVSNEEIQW